MALIVSEPKITCVAYNALSEPDPSLSFGEAFTSKGKGFLILSSKSIPRSKKIYLELTFTAAEIKKNVHYLPVNIGLHKEPSAGNLKNDFIFMSLYYTPVEDFKIFEKAKNGTLVEQAVGTLTARVPIVNSVIGVGIDMDNNQINLYVDGKLFYTITSQVHNFNSTVNGGWYFSIYGTLTQIVKGTINFGRYKMQYLPSGYTTLHKYYYEKPISKPPIVNPIPPPYNKYVRGDIDCKINITTEHPIDPLSKKRVPYLIYLYPGMQYESDDNLSFEMKSDRLETDSSDMVTINYPCPADPQGQECPVYIEFKITGAQLKYVDPRRGTRYIGIPIEIGLTDRINSWFARVFGIRLYHAPSTPYQSYSIIDGKMTNYNFPLYRVLLFQYNLKLLE